MADQFRNSTPNDILQKSLTFRVPPPRNNMPSESSTQTFSVHSSNESSFPVTPSPRVPQALKSLVEIGQTLLRISENFEPQTSYINNDSFEADNTFVGLDDSIDVGEQTSDEARTPIEDSPTNYRKRKRQVNEAAFNDESETPALGNLRSGFHTRKKRCYTMRRSSNDKLDHIFLAIQSTGWSFGQFMHEAFCMKESTPRATRRKHRHSTAIERFLRGQDKYTPSQILDAWLKSPDGRQHDDESHMFSTSTPYGDIKSIRPAITSFAAQIVKEEFVKEADAVIRVSSGLHASSSSGIALNKVEWTDIGSATAEHVTGILKTHQPLTWDLMMAIAERKPQVRKGVVAVRQQRPPSLVIF
jgi:hypothetical protein